MLPNTFISSPCALSLLLGLFALTGLLIAPTQSWAQQSKMSAAAKRAADTVCGNRIVMLGELPSHGESQAFQIKAQIVRRLVDRCGFDAVLFEAPIYDFLGFEMAAAKKKTATSIQLDRAIGRFWLTRELADWRLWLFERATSGRLLLGGIDDQVSATSDYARRVLPALSAASLPPQTVSECEQAIERNLYWRYDAVHPFDEAEQLRLQRCAADAASAQSRRKRINSYTPEQMMLDNLARYVSRQRGNPDAPDRDNAMYGNVLWYARRMPAGSKLIIWTSTVHSARQQGKLPQLPLGARLARRFGKRLAVIGFTALAGQSSMAAQPIRQLPQAPPESLEARSTDNNDAAAVFLDASALRRIGNVSSRLLGDFTSADWSGYFDAVIVIRHESAPVFEPRQ